jgi:diguanylate cyclase (GGDEF)-like protein
VDRIQTQTQAPFARMPLWRLARVASQLVLSPDRRRAIRLVQWVTAGGIYLGCAALMALGIEGGWMTAGRLSGWFLFVATGTAVAYVALRTGWSERFRDPALTDWQIAMGIVAVDWGYAICGPMRTLALLPLLVVFAFGAFALRWRQIAVLTTFALSSLGAVPAWLALAPPPWRDTPPAAGLPVDRINFLLVLVVLPALAVIAARLSWLRSTLRAQRARLMEALAEVQRLATTDELTGLPNRRWITERLAHEQQRADAEGSPFCLAILDLDRFKRINDRLGHARGDEVLRDFAHCARELLPARDTLARWGGEEFLLLMPGIALDEASARVRDLLQGVHRLQVEGAPLTFSAGVAQHAQGRDVLDDVIVADERLYVAKQAGRDRVQAG